MTADGGELQFDASSWASAGAQNGPVPPITPAQVAMVHSAIDQLLAALGVASNTGIPGDNLDAQTGQAEREAGVSDAQANFPANEQQSAQLLQALPQALSAAAGAFGGALGAALQPFGQLAQQGAQAAQQGLQAGLGAVEQAADPDADLSDDVLDEFPDDFAGTAGDSGVGADDFAGAAGGDTAPASPLGPPPIPSAATYPASAPTGPPPSSGSAAPPATPRAPMGAVPFMPPGAMQGGGLGEEPKAATKRVLAPSVRNGAPVQGRITTPPPAPPVTKHIKGKPVATRRIVVADPKTDEPDPDR
ncbi:hypothetical protein [Mycobacterium talmoniae]|nr:MULTISPECIES: hypothetical protein [Mycobacterium]